MTLAEIFADVENLPTDVTPLVVSENFAGWEITSETFGTAEVSLWKSGKVMIRKALGDDPYPSAVFVLTAEQMIWLGSLPTKLG